MNKYIILIAFGALLFFKRGLILSKVIKEIREKYNQGFVRKNSDVTEFVIHGTGGGSSAMGLIKWMLSGERAAEYSRGIALFHYLLDKDGTSYNIIDPVNWVYHSSSGDHDIHTIGVELVNSSATNSDSYTESQYINLAKLIFDTVKKFPNIKTITTHGYLISKYSGKSKTCPGNIFNFNKLNLELKNLGIVASSSVAGLILT
jgi:hypothetical protein